jgi:hypothetical protein
MLLFELSFQLNNLIPHLLIVGLVLLLGLNRLLKLPAEFSDLHAFVVQLCLYQEQRRLLVFFRGFFKVNSDFGILIPKALNLQLHCSLLLRKVLLVFLALLLQLVDLLILGYQLPGNFGDLRLQLLFQQNYSLFSFLKLASLRLELTLQKAKVGFKLFEVLFLFEVLLLLLLR